MAGYPDSVYEASFRIYEKMAVPNGPDAVQAKTIDLATIVVILEALIKFYKCWQDRRSSFNSIKNGPGFFQRRRLRRVIRDVNKMSQSRQQDEAYFDAFLAYGKSMEQKEFDSVLDGIYDKLATEAVQASIVGKLHGAESEL